MLWADGIPQCAVSVIKIDPKAQQVTTIGELPAGGWKWHGGVTGPDGCIYGAPCASHCGVALSPVAAPLAARWPPLWPRSMLLLPPPTACLPPPAYSGVVPGAQAYQPMRTLC